MKNGNSSKIDNWLGEIDNRSRSSEPIDEDNIDNNSRNVVNHRQNIDDNSQNIDNHSNKIDNNSSEIDSLLELEALLDNLNTKHERETKQSFNPYKEILVTDAARKPTDNEDDVNVVNIACLHDLESSRDTNDADRALLGYFVDLSRTNDDDFDYELAQHLVTLGNVNVVDKHGQSIMHEVAREWNTDVASFLYNRGAPVDVADRYGRTPLFVAVSSNHAKMVEWLLQNGANINQRTLDGEGQMAIHFAARYDCVETFDMLMKYGADPCQLDYRKKVPFYLAAEKGHVNMCQHMLSLDLPVATYCSEGLSTIDRIVENLPTEVALKALDQFVEKDGATELLYLSSLTKGRQKKMKDRMAIIKPPPTVLQIILDQKNLALISHRAIVELINVQAKFVRKLALQNVFWYFVFTILWTVSSSIHVPRDSTFRDSQHLTRARIILAITVFAQILGCAFMFKLYLEYKASVKNHNSFKTQQSESQRFNHPAWPIEQFFADKAAETKSRRRNTFFSDGWNIIEIVCLALCCLQTLLTARWYAQPNNVSAVRAKLYFSALFVICTWVRLNRCMGFLKWIGPFVSVLGECVIATARIGFLFVEFFIPLSISFWVLFGNRRKGFEGNEYESFNGLLYQLFLLTIVGDYEFDHLKRADHVFAQIFVTIYLFAVSIITFNIYIALLSEAFVRVNAISSATVLLNEAQEYNVFLNFFPSLGLQIDTYLDRNCSPMCVKSKKTVHPLSNQVKLGEAGRQMNYVTQELEKVNVELRNMDKSLESVAKAVSISKTNAKANIKGRILDVERFQKLPITVLHKKTRGLATRLLRVLERQNISLTSELVRRLVGDRVNLKD